MNGLFLKLVQFNILILCVLCNIDGVNNIKKFPNNFLFGVATSAYQIEGGYNVNGKGQSNWDYLIEQNPNAIIDQSNAKIACDSYNKYKEDVKCVKELGVDFYRFSLSWARILPNGYPNMINSDGISYYNNLINELLKNQIEPMITLYHLDLPQKLQQLGGWTNSLIADYFEDYARIAFRSFGDRVKYWITTNSGCSGHGDSYMAPRINQSGIADYLCVKNILLAHSKAYHLYNNEFRQKQNGKVGITIDTRWYEPATESLDDLEAAERARQFLIGTFLNPIYSPDGDFPEIVRKRVEEVSKREGLSKSRFPELTQSEIDYIRNSSDFLGMNSYTTFLISNIEEIDSLEPSSWKDMRVRLSQNPDWVGAKSVWLKVTPWGLRRMLKWIKETYNNPEIIITENGVSDDGQLDDQSRIEYYRVMLNPEIIQCVETFRHVVSYLSHFNEVLNAIYEDQVNVRGFTAWSLLDNFEWTAGYTEKFGLYHVDFQDPNRKRTAKSSAKWYKNFLKQRSLENFDKISMKGEL